MYSGKREEEQFEEIESRWDAFKAGKIKSLQLDPAKARECQELFLDAVEAKINCAEIATLSDCLVSQEFIMRKIDTENEQRNEGFINHHFTNNFGTEEGIKFQDIRDTLAESKSFSFKLLNTHTYPILLRSNLQLSEKLVASMNKAIEKINALIKYSLENVLKFNISSVHPEYDFTLLTEFFHKKTGMFAVKHRDDYVFALHLLDFSKRESSNSKSGKQSANIMERAGISRLNIDEDESLMYEVANTEYFDEIAMSKSVISHEKVKDFLKSIHPDVSIALVTLSLEEEAHKFDYMTDDIITPKNLANHERTAQGAAKLLEHTMLLALGAKKRRKRKKIKLSYRE